MNWYTRALSWIPWRRAAAVPAIEQRPDEPTVDRPALARWRAGPAYSVEASMASYAAFPIVAACVRAVADDWSKLEWRIRRKGAPDADPSDPVYRLLYRPTVRGSGVLLWRQVATDHQLTGTAYVRVIGAGGPVERMSLVRLHPSECTIIAWADGQPGIVEYRPGGGSTVIRLTPGVDVLLFRSPSWRAGDAGVYGTGLVEVLHRELALARAAAERTRESTTRGRPAMIARPPAVAGAGPMADFTPHQVQQIQAALQAACDEADGTIAVMPRSLDFTVPSWSPRDLMSLEISEAAALRIMAAAGVPPHRISFPVANAGPPRDADRVYWGNVEAFSELIGDVITNWLDTLPGYLNAWVERDFRANRAVQFPQDGAIQRATALKALGVRADVALRLQGIEVPADGWAVDPATGGGPGPSPEGERPSEGAGMTEPTPDQTRPQGRQVAPEDVPEPVTLDHGAQALARLLAKGE